MRVECKGQSMSTVSKSKYKLILLNRYSISSHGSKSDTF